MSNGNWQRSVCVCVYECESRYIRNILEQRTRAHSFHIYELWCQRSVTYITATAIHKKKKNKMKKKIEKHQQQHFGLVRCSIPVCVSFSRWTPTELLKFCFSVFFFFFLVVVVDYTIVSIIHQVPYFVFRYLHCRKFTLYPHFLRVHACFVLFKCGMNVEWYLQIPLGKIKINKRNQKTESATAKYAN